MNNAAAAPFLEVPCCLRFLKAGRFAAELKFSRQSGVPERTLNPKILKPFEHALECYFAFLECPNVLLQCYFAQIFSLIEIWGSFRLSR